MQIEIRSRNGIAITDDLRQYAARRFEKVDKMVSDLARLELELKDEHNPAISDHFSVDATLHVKGKTLRACDRSFDLKHAMHEVSDELARQVDKLSAKRRARRAAQRNTPKAMGAQPGGLAI
jgi:putative sigma-54 modulation protein